MKIERERIASINNSPAFLSFLRCFCLLFFCFSSVLKFPLFHHTLRQDAAVVVAVVFIEQFRIYCCWHNFWHGYCSPVGINLVLILFSCVCHFILLCCFSRCQHRLSWTKIFGKKLLGRTEVMVWHIVLPRSPSSYSQASSVIIFNTFQLKHHKHIKFIEWFCVYVIYTILIALNVELQRPDFELTPLSGTLLIPQEMPKKNHCVPVGRCLKDRTEIVQSQQHPTLRFIVETFKSKPSVVDSIFP